VAADRDIDRLYSLPLNDFTKARNDLVRRLRKAGKKEAAEEAKALKKPAATAWAVNQLARRAPAKIAELIKAGDSVRKAQRDALGGKEADVREASRVQHALADELLDDARALLEEGGGKPTQAAVHRMLGTLRAASTDPAAAKLLRAGRLTEDVESVGFGPMLHVAPKGRRRARKTAPRRAKTDAKRKRLDAARQALREAEREAAGARKALAQAEREAERTAARVEAAERKVAALDRGRR
jgi:hypothetical protein